MLHVSLGPQYLEGLMCLYSDMSQRNINPAALRYDVFRGKAGISNGLPCVCMVALSSSLTMARLKCEAVDTKASQGSSLEGIAANKTTCIHTNIILFALLVVYFTGVCIDTYLISSIICLVADGHVIVAGIPGVCGSRSVCRFFRSTAPATVWASYEITPRHETSQEVAEGFLRRL